MKNILTIYKFNFPFFESTYEYMKSKAIISDIKKLFLYRDIEYTESKEIKGDYIINTITFLNGSIRIIFHDDDENYFIPKFQFDLYFEGDIDNLLFIELIKIFESVGLSEYIFSFEKLPAFIDNFDILILKSLETNFINYNYSNLNKFIDTTENEYIDDKLRENKLIRNSFYYMIFVCYVFYKNIIDTEEKIKDIDGILEKNIKIIYKNNLDFGKCRLEELESISLVNLKKYKLMLDELFGIFK